MTYEVKYQRAASPSKGPQPGTKVLRDWVLNDPRFSAATDLGIYNPRKIRGRSRGWSVHAEGRAWDCGFPVFLEGHAQGHVLAHLLVDHHTVFGVQQVIWAHRVWTVGRGWRRYTGTSPHTDHLHLEQVWDAALGLTETQILEGLNPPPPEPKEHMIAEIVAAYQSGGDRNPSPRELANAVKEIRDNNYDLTEFCLYRARQVEKETT